MANLISRATGNFSSSATWKSADSGGAQTATTSSTTASTTSYVYSPTFTIANTNVITGLLLYVRRASATGTFSVSLSEDNGVTATKEVTINTTDIPATTTANPTWVFFPFASNYTADGGSDYRVGIKSSSASSVTVYRSTTTADWAKLLCSNTAAAPAASDVIYVVGENSAAGVSASYTVTMDNADAGATTFGAVDIGNGGILSWGTTASTAYYLKIAGDLRVQPGGTYHCGTSGTPIPSSSSAVLEFACGSDGQYGFQCWSSSTVKMYGSPRTAGKNVVQTLLTSDHSSGVTTLNVADDTGWLAGDEIYLAPTNVRDGSTQLESRVLNANAGASSLVITVATSSTHHGGVADPDVVAEVINVTRNVVVKATTVNLNTYIQVNQNISAFDVEWVQFLRSGMSTTSKAGLYISGVQTAAITSRYCSMVGSRAHGVYIEQAAAGTNFSVRDYVCIHTNGSTTAGGITCFSNMSPTATVLLQNCTVMCGSGSTNVGIYITLQFTTLGHQATNVTLSNLRITGAVVAGLWINGWATGLTVSDVIVHNANSPGIQLTGSSSEGFGIIDFTNCKVWRGGNPGLSASTGAGLMRLNNCAFFGNSTSNIAIANGAIEMNGGIIAGDTSFSTATGIITTGAINIPHTFYVKLNNVSVGVASGLKTSLSSRMWGHGLTTTARDALMVQFLAVGGTTPALDSTQLNSLLPGSFIGLQTSARQLTANYTGTVEIETTTFDVTPAIKMTPRVAATKLESHAGRIGRGFLVPVTSGNTVTPSVKVRKDSSYNGNAPRLILKANYAIGITADAVLDTLSVGVDTWETLSGTTSAASADGVMEFVVDCDGTAGSIYVDTWAT